jgi:hypothetical protein
MSETLQAVNNEARHRFEVSLDAETAYAEYRLAAGEITLTHTEVPKAFEGRGVASQLARAALGYARAQGLKVIPLCPFMAAYITKHPEWRDLVKASCRARLGIGA